MSIPKNSNLVEQLNKYPFMRHFSKTALHEIVSQSKIIEAEADEVLFSSDEPANYLYYMIDGCMEVFLPGKVEKRTNIIRSGEMAGEMGVVSAGTYGLTCRVHRPSRLLKIDKNLFLSFFQRDPELLMQLTQTMAKRLHNLVIGMHRKHYSYKNIVLYVMSPIVNIEKIKTTFQACSSKDDTRIYDKQTFDMSKMDIVSFLFHCEDNPGVNIFLIESLSDAWSNAIFLHVEYVYIWVDEGCWDAIDPRVLDNLKRRPCDLVIWHQQQAPYSNTHRFYERYAFKRSHHLTDIITDYQRLYRFMTGQAIGLVISGGGFRGYAHYGLIKALCESGVPIDCIGGSSMGAVVGAGLAINFNWDKFNLLYEKAMGRLKSKRFFGFTWPIFSVLSGKWATKILKETYGSYQIADLPINFWCVTSNLSKRQKEVKHQGELWEWLRASMAIPGVFPPLEKNGSIYVDGAVCTNLPVQDMRDYLDNAGTIITLDISLPLLPQNKYIFPPVLTLYQALAYKLGLSKKNYIFPALFDIILESSSINQYIYDTQGAKDADIIIAPDTSSLSFLDPTKDNPLSLMAYDFATKILQEKKALYERWIR